MVMGFIEAHHKDMGIEPICRELAVAHRPGTNMLPALLMPASGQRVPRAMTR